MAIHHGPVFQSIGDSLVLNPYTIIIVAETESKQR